MIDHEKKHRPGITAAAGVMFTVAALYFFNSGQLVGAAELLQGNGTEQVRGAEQSQSSGQGQGGSSNGEQAQGGENVQTADLPSNEPGNGQPTEEEVIIPEINVEVEPEPPLPYEEAGLSADDWRLILVNAKHKIPDDYDVTVTDTVDWQEIDERVAEHLEEMIEDCRDEGYEPVVCSGYRSMDKQISLFEADVRKYMWRGYSREEAEELTAQTLAIPGTSEHEIGMAADIVSRSNQRLEEAQEDTGTQQWLMENCWRYGFILRYPEDKAEITGISYEPWHYRYVGPEAAEYIYDHDICLEEFLGITDEEPEDSEEWEEDTEDTEDSEDNEDSGDDEDTEDDEDSENDEDSEDTEDTGDDENSGDDE